MRWRCSWSCRPQLCFVKTSPQSGFLSRKNVPFSSARKCSLFVTVPPQPAFPPNLRFWQCTREKRIKGGLLFVHEKTITIDQFQRALLRRPAVKLSTVQSFTGRRVMPALKKILCALDLSGSERIRSRIRRYARQDVRGQHCGGVCRPHADPIHGFPCAAEHHRQLCR